MNPIPGWLSSLGLDDPITYAVLFLASSLFMLWRLEAIMDRGFEGTALGTLVMPLCSGLGNLLFVFIVARGNTPAQEVMTNAVVNNVTNLTLLLGLPALLWGLAVVPSAESAKRPRRGSRAKVGADAGLPQRLNRLSLVLTLFAVVFFSGTTWALAEDGVLDFSDGLVLTGLFVFWQTFQVYDVLKHNTRQRLSLGAGFWLDLLLVLAGGIVLFTSIDELVTWLTRQQSGFFSAANLGWLTGWLMVLPNALLAFFYAARKRPEVVYASQVGDGHICIPLGIGLFALLKPLPMPPHANWGLMLLMAGAGLHVLCLLFAGGLPRWLGGALVAAYAAFVVTGWAG
ncbi:MAG: sodium:calcium symporter [Rariglobus sp.]|jgi:cation:H+ antiporter|nr:sodium:calcium symporter [Rariglobus sp.]